MSTLIATIAEKIKDKGRHSTSELPPLLEQAEQIAGNSSESLLTRGLAHRAAGNALRLMNKFELSLAHYRQAIEHLEEAGEPLELARTLHAKLVPLFFIGNFDELFADADRARKLFESLGDRRGIARLNVNLAHAYHRLDRHHEALECSEAAVRILDEVGDAEGFVAASINSAATLTSMHEFERAERHYENARQTAQANDLWSSVLLCRHNSAYLRYFAGDAQAALQEYRTLHDEYRKLNDDWQICRCLLDEAEIYLEIGELEEAIRTARESCTLARKLELNLEIGRALMFEAAACQRLDRSDEAAPLLQEATRRFEREGNTIWSAAAKLQAVLLMEGDRESALPDAIAARARLHGAGLPHRLAMADIVIGRIQQTIGDVECATQSFRSALSAARQSRSEWMQFHAAYELGKSLLASDQRESGALFQHAEQMLDRLWSRLGSDDLKMAFLSDRENVYTHLVRAAQDSPALAFELAERSRSRILREQLIAPGIDTSCAGIQSRLKTNECVLEYFIAGNDLYIFTVTSRSIDCTLRQGVVQSLRTACEHLDRHMSSCSVTWEKVRSAHDHLKKTAAAHLAQFREHLVEPVIHRLTNTVIVVPHGFLHGVPFHAFLDERQVRYSPSALLYCTPSAGQHTAPPLFVAFSRNSLSTINEVESAAAHFPGATVLINPMFGELRDAFAEVRSLVHIAGHAGIDTVGGKLSWIDAPDRRLTGRDLVDMHIRAETIVITGCQTARRAIRPGDEWQGLMRAFYTSGANAIVSAFWDIRDEAARRFASAFYPQFDGSNAAAAVQAACETLKGWQPHPYFWAGFAAFVRRTT